MNGSVNPLQGRVLGGIYRIEELIGEGGQAAVFRARHLRTDGLFAIKVLLNTPLIATDAIQRFQDEARIVSSLRHPNIIQCFDLADEDGMPYIVMELLDGEALSTRLARLGLISLEDALNIAEQVASALHTAHSRGVVHRDIKPQNLFLVNRQLPGGRSEIIKVLDFGICKFRRALTLTHNTGLLGTPSYMAPEAALGFNHQLDHRADQYALAVVLYQALSGRLPFEGNDPIAVLYKVTHDDANPLCDLQPGIPQHIASTIARAMSKNPDHRFPSIIDFAQSLMPQRRTNRLSLAGSILASKKSQVILTFSASCILALANGKIWRPERHAVEDARPMTSKGMPLPLHNSPSEQSGQPPTTGTQEGLHRAVIATQPREVVGRRGAESSLRAASLLKSKATEPAMRRANERATEASRPAAVARQLQQAPSLKRLEVSYDDIFK